MTRGKSKRRGVVLLVVLSLLVLFLVIGLMYAIIASTYKQSAEAGERAADKWADSKAELDRAFYMLMRDTVTRNPLVGHSLLNDLYGHHFVDGLVVVGAQAELDGQMMTITCLQKSTPPSVPLTDRYLRREDGVYAGCVLTFVSGRAAHTSTRIFANAWTPGSYDPMTNAPQWGRPGVDDQTIYNGLGPPMGPWVGDGNVDDIGERGWAGSDDVLVLRIEIPESEQADLRGVDQRWGVAGVDDDGNSATDDVSEAGWPGSDDRMPGVGDLFMINGRQFSGTGAGYDPSTGTLDAIDPASTPLVSWWGGTGDRPNLALLPNYAAYPTSFVLDYSTPNGGLPYTAQAVPGYQAGGVFLASIGGLNEDWEAPDPQNMFLAYVPANNPGGGSNMVARRADQIIPSFHRPELVGYWFRWLQDHYFGPKGYNHATEFAEERAIFLQPYGPNNNDNTYWPTNASHTVTREEMSWLVGLKRRIILRPLPEDHPAFTGSNFHPATGFPNFHPWMLGTEARDLDNDGNPDIVIGAWDVDNDGDGTYDSIWIDPQFPVKTAPDGRKYKTLVAYLVVDMDGRLQLNAHDNLAQLDPTFSAPLTGHFARVPAILGTSNFNLPRGEGYGAAEVSLFPLLNFTGTLPERTNLIASRYVGRDGTSLPGIGNTSEVLTFFKSVGVPQNFSNYSVPSWYGTPPDLFGRGAIGVDYNGQPMYFNMGQLNETIDPPYEINLVQGTGQSSPDTPYAYGELETVLRPFDLDFDTLPQRLNQFLTMQHPVARSAVTTTARHIPTPGGALAREWRTGAALANNPAVAMLMGGARAPTTIGTGNASDNWIIHPDYSFPTILDMYRARLLAGGVAPALVEQHMAVMVPFELLRAEPMDVNRPFGNGIDDTAAGTPGVGTVDEPLETLTGELAFPGAPAPYNTAPFNYQNDTPLSAGLNPRVLYARHLYCLMMLMIERDPNNPAIPYYAFPVDPTDPDVSNPTKQAMLTAQRVAQWAVNCVDFRDSDAIMTVFEYDLNPWDGWDVDCDPRTVNEGSLQGNNERAVVIGAESPDLMLTESFAFHDKGLKETAAHQERGPMMDEDPDQFRRPQGSLYLELFNPRTYLTNNVTLPMELYNSAGPLAGRLDLTRLSPARPDNFQAPVWQVAISRHHDSGTTPSSNDGPLLRKSSHPETTSFDPMDMGSGLPTYPRLNLPVERWLWFTPVGNPATLPLPFRHHVYFDNRGQSSSLAPGQYGVVGPRPVTYIGSLENDSDTKTWDGNSQQRIEIGPGGVSVYDMNGALRTPNVGSQIQQPIGFVLDAPTPNWGGNNPYTQYSGMNVTEPVPDPAGNYYPEPNSSNTAFDPMMWNSPPDAYDNLFAPVLFPDAPMDYQTGRPIHDNNMEQIRTYLNRRSVFLQRLADPTLPWNPRPEDPVFGNAGSYPYYNPNLPVNPYVTVDWAPIDVTVFNGDEDVDRQVNMVDLDPADPENHSREHYFTSRQRGNRMDNPAPFKTANLWSTSWVLHTTAAIPNLMTDPQRLSYRTNDISRPPAPPMGGEYMRWVNANGDSLGNRPYYPIQTLGYLSSREFGADEGLGRLDITIAPPQYAGSPADAPFPWLAYYNRPYNTPYEMMLVPASAPGRLMFEFSTLQSAQVPYDPRQGVSSFRYPYRHLLNFYHQSLPSSGGNPYQSGANLFRVFDFLRTPSPFAGTERWFNPVQTTAQATPNFLRPPYNRWSRFRDPGHINLNTIPITHWTGGPDGAWGVAGVDDDASGTVDDFSEAGWNGSDDEPRSLVWDGLMQNSSYNASPGLARSTFLSYFQSRQGYPGGFCDATGIYPTRFVNPFRGSFAADMMPDLRSVTPFPTRKMDVEATTFRPQLPYLSVSSPPAGGPYPPVFLDPNGTGPHDSPSRHAAFLYQGQQRMPNLTTTHSNVYAVWLTVGYFEVTPNIGVAGAPLVDEGHLDGYQLGPELGIDTGEVRRHRAFYIIDRSIPVGFEPGQNHNVDKTVLLRRIIE